MHSLQIIILNVSFHANANEYTEHAKEWSGVSECVQQEMYELPNELARKNGKE